MELRACYAIVLWYSFLMKFIADVDIKKIVKCN